MQIEYVPFEADQLDHDINQLVARVVALSEMYGDVNAYAAYVRARVDDELRVQLVDNDFS